MYVIIEYVNKYPAALVIWRDACFTTEDTDNHSHEPITLLEMGFVIRETDEAISLCCEHPGNATASRYVLTIPRVNIELLEYIDVSKPLKRFIRQNPMSLAVPGVKEILNG